MDKSLVTVDKIIEKSKQWTLEGDCTLLQWMNQISKNLEERVTKTNTALNEMSTKLDRTSVALSNVTNNLAALQYSQFVENRVHDDDETLANIRDAPDANKDVTDKKDANHNIYSFLKKNLEMMNSCHEAYSISFDDSDEDEPATNVVYRSKNPYEAQSLPHIYGSKLWKEKWHIGLCDSDNDFSGDEESEQFSESSSTADDSYESTAQTMSEWDSTAWGLNTNLIPDRKDTHTPSNDGESSYQGENSSQSEVSTPRPQKNQPIVQPVQDQRYYQHVQRNTEANFHDIFTDREQKTVSPKVVSQPPSQKIIGLPSLIADEPPLDADPVESDNSRLIGAKKPLNLFDDDEFSSFMDQIVKTANNKSARGGNAPQEITKKAVVSNLFDDSVQTATNPNVGSSGLPKEQPKKAAVPNLFDDSEDIRSDIPQKPPKKAVVANLFDESEDIFTPKVSESFVTKKKDAIPKHNEDIFVPPSLPNVPMTRTKNLFDDDDDDDDDDFEKIFAAKASKNIKFTAKTKNLFDDDDVLEDLAGAAESASEDHDNKVKKATVKEVPLLRKGLFDDDEDDLQMEKDIYASKPVKKNDLFQDVFSERPKNVPALGNDLFGENVSGLKNNLFSGVDKVTPETVSVPDAIKSKAGTILKTDLFADVFQDEPPDDIFAQSSDKSKTKIANIFADNLADDFEEFVPKSAPSKAALDIKQGPTYDISQDLEVDVAQKPVVTVETNNQKESKIASTLSSEKTKINVGAVVADKPTENFEKLVSKLETGKSKDVAEEKAVPPIGEVDAASKAKSTTKLPDIARKPLDAINKTATASSTKKKASETDIFADGFVDDFEEFIPKLSARNPNKKVAEKVDAVDDSCQNEDTIRVEVKPPTADMKPLINKVKPTKPGAKPNSAKLKSTISTKLPDIADPTIDLKEEVIPAGADVFEKLKKDDVPSTRSEDTPVTETLPATTNEISFDSNPETSNQTAVHSYTSLFHDEPPPDDNVSFVPSFEEPPADEEPLVETPPNAAYNSINLFADVPPDDDFSIVPPVKTKRIHSIFYDDFNETIEATREMRAPSTYIFNDEPPPDDDDALSSKVVAKEEPKAIKERPKVSKLKKMDLNINVGALLPTAKAPSFKKPSSISVPPEDDNKPREVPIVKPVEHRDLPENILPNLNRDRARVQVKRRPSTRKGRQESYRKSMVEDVAVEANEGSDEGDQLRSDKTLQKPSSLFEDFGSFDVKKTNLSEIFSVKPIPDQTSENVVQNSQSSASKIPSLFEDSDTDTRNIFETLHSKKESPKPSPPKVPSSAKIIDSLFDTDDVDENPFGTPTKINDTPPLSSDTTQVPYKATPSSSLFEESTEEEQPVTAPPTRTITKSAFTSPEERTRPPSKSTSLFGKSDEGSDDLFKESKTTKKSSSQKTAEKKQKPKPVSQPVKAATSLFSSDEESGSGDDIFGKPKMKAVPKKVESAKAKPSSSLFADLSDDDDDDLFGSTKKKPSGAGKLTSKPPTTKTPPAKTSAQTPISNNPLSDLLGP